MKVRGEVIGGTGVRDPGSWGGIRWCGGGHGSELCWRMPALVGVIHALIAVNRSMTKLVADLAGRTRIRAWIPRLGILGILTEFGEYSLIVEITRRTTTGIVRLEPSITSTMIAGILITTSTSISIKWRKARLRVLVGYHRHMSNLFGVIHGTLEQILFSLH